MVPPTGLLFKHVNCLIEFWNESNDVYNLLRVASKKQMLKIDTLTTIK